MSIYSFYTKWIFPKLRNIRGSHLVKRNLKRAALRNVETIPESEREGIEEREWDNLIILDACRYDLFEEAVGKSDFRYSIGSTSSEFIERNFSEGDWKDTVYVTANPHFEQSIFEDLTGSEPEEVFHEVFHTYDTDWDEEERTILPEDVVRDAETAAKLFPDKKLIVHFMQPHFPFIDSDLRGDGIGMVDGNRGKSIWDEAELGAVEGDKLWEPYRDNLKIVLEYVRTLETSLKGRTVVTADHGNLIGEGGVYGHPGGCHLKPLVQVPWHVISES